MVPLISLKNISIEASSRRKWFRYGLGNDKLVDDVSFDIMSGKCFGLVGEDTSGKLPITFAILGLNQVSSGQIEFEQANIAGLSRKAFHPFRKEIQAVFWDDFRQLNPRFSLDQSFRQAIRVWDQKAENNVILNRIESAMDLVKLPASARYQTPLELDPVDRQLAAIARAMIMKPKFLIAQEITRGLDVVEQAEVLNRLSDIRDQTGVTLLLVTDDLAVAEHMSDTIGVLHRGSLLETGPSGKIATHPEHDYTRRLVSSTVTYSPS